MPSSDNAPAPGEGAQTTLELLTRVRDGDTSALNQLIDRCLPELRRWASGRLPGWSRRAADTDDFVQETVIRAFKKIGEFEYRGDGALLAYLRQALLNRIRSEIRKAQRRPTPEPLLDVHQASGLSPLETAIGVEQVEKYEAALDRLRPEEREAIIARLELGLTYSELARALGKPTPDAARMAVSRALVRLTEELRSVRAAHPPA